MCVVRLGPMMRGTAVAGTPPGSVNMVLTWLANAIVHIELYKTETKAGS